MDKEAAKTHILVDLDGTLATYTTWQGEDHIGDPIPLMVNRVKRWLREGKEVKIFTARLAASSQPDRTVSIIQSWCRQHIGKALPVTNVKDQFCEAIWDDRAFRVTRNTGRQLMPKFAEDTSMPKFKRPGDADLENVYPEAGARALPGVQKEIVKFREMIPEERAEAGPLLYYLLGGGTPAYKMAPEDAEYEEGTPEENCANCRFLYQAMGHGDKHFICSQIRGQVRQEDRCRLWNPAEIADDMLEKDSASGKDSNGNDITDFSWVYVDMPDDIKKKVLAYGKGVDKEDLHEKGQEEDPHITVLYGLHTNDSEPVRAVMKTCDPVTASVGKLSVFELPDYNVLKLEIKSPGLTKLNKKLKDSDLEATITFPDYNPHVTIAYLKKDVDYKKYTEGDGVTVDKEIKFDHVFFGDKDRKNHKINLEGKVEKEAQAMDEVEKKKDRKVSGADVLKFLALLSGVGAAGYGAHKYLTSPVDEEGDSTNLDYWRTKFNLWNADRRLSKRDPSKADVEVETGLHRVVLPEDQIAKDLLDNLGYFPSLVAIPERGQEQMTSYRHPKSNLHLHKHPGAYTVHKDRHTPLSMSMVDPDLSIGEKLKKIPEGIAHLFTEGVPGAANMISGHLKGQPKMTESTTKAGSNLPVVEMVVKTADDRHTELTVEIAEGPDAEYVGLGGRDHLPDGHGMLFKSAKSFCMRDCNFDLDIVFMDKYGKVKDVQHMVKLKPGEPEKVYTSKEAFDLALELPSGWCGRNGVNSGSVVSVKELQGDDNV